MTENAVGGIFVIKRVTGILKGCLLWLAAACFSLYLVILGFVVLNLSLDNKSFLVLTVLGLCWIAIMVKFFRKRIGRATKWLAVAAASATLILWGGWILFSRNAGYENPDMGKTGLFSDRKVMVIVPHQDDELNMMGGVLEEFVKYGSEVYVVFTTNGDFTRKPHIRYQEALTVLGKIGIPAENAIFLGYGDQWAYGYPHIYNSEKGQVIPSVAGKTQTYGVDFHSAYREGRAYTVENLREDLQSVILEYRPEQIFCADYDPHVDHKAWSMTFDRVMGDILKSYPDYRPGVYKGFCYPTAWTAPMDYYRDNIAATAWFQLRGTTYRWEDRIRLPVNAGMLSRSLVTSPGFRQLKDYSSQGAYLFAGQILNGDRLFWRRNTDSLCLQADIQASSGESALLNDFMRLENHNVRDETRAPNDGVWIPEEQDAEKCVTVQFREPAVIDHIVLYDHPSEQHNVVHAEILFEDGSSIGGICLDPEGAATVVPVGKENVRSFEIRLLGTEGEEAGLTEIEAFSQPQNPEWKFIKLMDPQGNFVYDYWTEEGEETILALYTQGITAQGGGPEISLSNDRCHAQWEDGSIRIVCPKGEKTVLTVSAEAGAVSDSVVIRNPGAAVRALNGFYQRVEARITALYYGFRYGIWEWEPSAEWVMNKCHILNYYIMKYLF